MMSSSPVAITGLGCICAAGNDLDTCITSLFAGSHSPAPPTRFGSTHEVPYPVFEVRGFTERPDILRTAALGLRAAREALADAGLDEETLRHLRVGVCVGTTIGCAVNNETFCRAYRSGGTPDLAPIERIMRSNPATVIAREFGLSGPCHTVVNACSSGTDAVGIGASWIRSGLCDVVLAGGADELDRITYNGFISLMITDDSPCKPFDRERKGLNLGEGAAMLVLEAEGVRRERCSRARSYLLGYGSVCDAHHLTAPKPDGTGLKRAIAEALHGTGLGPGDVAFVNAHGTGTPDNDRVEALVLSEVLPGTPFLSTKGYTGHTLGAAGAIEAAYTVVSLERGMLPPNAGFATSDPALAGTPVREVTAINGSVALSESLAFGGNNAVIVLGAGDAP